MVARRSTRNTDRNGATAASEITSTGRLRIAGPGTTPRPESSRFAFERPNGWGSPTKSTRWKFWSAAVIFRSRMSNGLHRSSGRALHAPPITEAEQYAGYRNQTLEPVARYPREPQRDDDRGRGTWRFGQFHAPAVAGGRKCLLGEIAGRSGARRTDRSRCLRRRSTGRNGNAGAGPCAQPAAPC